MYKPVLLLGISYFRIEVDTQFGGNIDQNSRGDDRYIIKISNFLGSGYWITFYIFFLEYKNLLYADVHKFYFPLLLA